jgi:hypothetical protein
MNSNKEIHWYDRFNKLWFGLIFGLIIPCLTLAIVYKYSFSQFGYKNFILYLSSMQIMTKLFSLCVLPNLGLFFLYMWKNLLFGARGVIAGTMIAAIIVTIIQFA